MVGRGAVLDQVFERLSRITDPCSARNRTPLSLTEMGIVENVAVTDDGEVTVRLLLTDPSCVFFFDIARSIEEHLVGLGGVAAVKVESIGDRWWEPDRMTPEVQARLARMRARRHTQRA